MSDTSLTYGVGADTSKFDAAMARLRSTTQKTTAEMLFAFTGATAGINRSMAGVEAQVVRTNAAVTQGTGSVGAYGKAIGVLGEAVGAFVLGAAALEGVGEIARRLSDDLNDATGRVTRLLQIASTSDSTGLGTSFLQSLLGQAKDLGIEASRVVQILDNVRKAGAVTQGEGAAGSVGALNAAPLQRRLTQQQVSENVTSAERRPFDDAVDAKDVAGQIKAVLDLLDKLDARGKSLTANDLAKYYFGDGFERKTQGGIAFLNALRTAPSGAAGSTGRVASPEEVARVAELKRELQEIDRIYNGTLSQASKDIALYQDVAAQEGLKWKKYVAEVVSNFRDVYAEVRNIVGEAVKFGQALGLIDANFGVFKSGSQTRKTASATVDSGYAGEGNLMGRLVTRMGISGASQADLDRQTEAGQMAAARERLRRNLTSDDVKHAEEETKRMDFRDDPLKATIKPTGQDKPIIDRNRGGLNAEDPDAVEQYIRQLNKARDVQIAELAAVGKTVTEREQLVDLAQAEARARDDFEKGRRSSASLDEDEKARVVAVAKATGDLRAKILDVEQAQSHAAETARYWGQQLTDSLSDAVFESRSLDDAFSNLAKTIAKAALQAELLGTGPLAAFLGTGPLAAFLGTAPAASAGPNAIGGLLGQLGGSSSNLANAISTGGFNPFPGFADGGYTGSESRDEPAGIVHRGEYVVPKVAVARIGLPMLDALARGFPGYATGGLVGMAGMTALPTAGIAGNPRINFIDQRPAGSPDIAPTTRRNGDGGFDLIIRTVEARMGQRAARGQGPFRSVGGPWMNKG